MPRRIFIIQFCVEKSHHNSSQKKRSRFVVQVFWICRNEYITHLGLFFCLSLIAIETSWSGIIIMKMLVFSFKKNIFSRFFSPKTIRSYMRMCLWAFVSLFCSKYYLPASSSTCTDINRLSLSIYHQQGAIALLLLLFACEQIPVPWGSEYHLCVRTLRKWRANDVIKMMLCIFYNNKQDKKNIKKPTPMAAFELWIVDVLHFNDSSQLKTKNWMKRKNKTDKNNP